MDRMTDYVVCGLNIKISLTDGVFLRIKGELVIVMIPMGLH